MTGFSDKTQQRTFPGVPGQKPARETPPCLPHSATSMQFPFPTPGMVQGSSKPKSLRDWYDGKAGLLSGMGTEYSGWTVCS